MNYIKKISCADFCFGKPSNYLIKAIDWLNTYKLRKEEQNVFDFPDYWGMPKSISKNLSPDDVDFIQEQTYNLYKK